MGFFSFINKQLPAIGTLFLIACFGSIYFLIYVPQNEKNIREQRFRALQNLDRNIHEKIENSKKLVRNWLDRYPWDTHYLASFPKDRFVLSATTTNKKRAFDTLKVAYDKVEVNFVDSGDVIADKVVLFSRRLKTQQKDSSYDEVKMSFSFGQFFGSLLLVYGNIFDHFVILKDNKVIFQDFPAGVREMDEDSLLGGSRGFRVAGVHDITVGGTDYKIFSQPVNIGQRFTVNGLVSTHRYQREKKQLPTQIILSLIILVVIIILLFPWIKLFHMGSKDRLTLWDAIATLSASMLLMSLLFLSFLNYNSHYPAGNKWAQHKFLADTITHSLQTEIGDIYYRLKRLDGIRQRDSLADSYAKIRNGTVTFFDDKQQQVNKMKKVDDSGIIASASNQAIKYIYWLDTTGEEKSIWTTDTILAPHGNYNERPYFRKIMANKGYYLDDSDRYYLDQIVSWITGDFRSVISVPAANGDSAVAAVTFDMQSLKDMVLPPGFLFAMINDSGKVLYHSQSFRNLNENLFSEFSNQDKLRSCLVAHKISSFKTDYFSKQYSVYVKPIAGLPYFIVILEDTAYEQTRDTNIFTFSLSMLFFFFLFLTLETLTIYFIAPKKSFFKKQLFDATWIGPKPNNRPDYVAATVFNLALILLLIILPHYTSFLGYLFMLLFSSTSSPLFLNYLYARRYKEKNRDHYLIKRKVINCFRAIALFIDLGSFFLLDWLSILKLIAYEVTVAIIALVIYRSFHWEIFQESRIPDFFRRAIGRFFKDSFSFMALTRLVITSAIPIVFFYIASYNHEENISTRNRQALFLTNVAEKLAAKNSKNQATDSNSAIYYDGTIVSNSFHAVTGEPKADTLTDEQMRAIALLRQFRLRITDESVLEEDFDEPSSDDRVLVYKNRSNGALNRSDTTFRQGHNSGQYLRVESNNLGYHFPTLMGRDGALFWFFLMVSLIIFFVIIRGIVKKMFALLVPDLTKVGTFDEEIFKDQTLNKLVFVVGPPGAGKTNLIKEKIKSNEIIGTDGKHLRFESVLDSSDTAVFADMIHIPDSSSDEDEANSWKKYSECFLAEKNKLVVVNHFEYNIQDPETNRAKLNFLEKLMLSDKRKIIILSTIHPVAFLDSAFIDSNSSNRNKKGDKNEPEKAMPEDLERWHVLLGHYRIVLIKLNESSLSEKNKIEEADLAGVDKAVKAMLERETKWGQFLNKMQPAVIKAAEGMKQQSPSADEWAFKMQVTSYYFYMYIWQSLTREEKFLLYDLAEDNLVNSSDDYNLSMLIGKGLIIRDDDDTLRIFNDGFRNFILTAIGNTEAMKIKDQIRENGYWAKLKTPLTILIVAILAFLLASQEETYTKLIAYFTALAGGIPVILRVFSLFSKGSQQSS